MLSNLGLGDIAAPENKNTGARKMSKRRFLLPQSEKLFTEVSVRGGSSDRAIQLPHETPSGRELKTKLYSCFIGLQL
jgi:hypothetical protein